MTMLLVFLAVIGAGLLIYGTYSEKKQTALDQTKADRCCYSSNRSDTDEGDEVSRALFGRYIAGCGSHYDVEVTSTAEEIPSYDKIYEMLTQMETDASLQRLRASCSICKKNDGYLHRWFFCCVKPDVESSLERIAKRVLAEYRVDS